MQIHHYHPDTGLLLGTSQADESPLEPGVHLIQAHATASPPPAFGAGERVLWDGAAWRVEAVPVTPAPPPPTLAESQASAVMRIKAKAGEVILARLPGWKQANLTARAMELLVGGATASPEFAGIQSQWTWVKSVRWESDQGEAAVLVVLDDAGVAAALESALIAIDLVAKDADVA